MFDKNTCFNKLFQQRAIARMVTRLDGRVVASGKGTPLLNLPSGIYIVRQGNQARKVVVK
jgi:hypothetical protein